MPFDPEYWTDLFSAIVSDVLAWLPNLVAALLLLLVGWMVARVVQFILASLLRRLRLDILAERAGVSQLLEDSGLDRSASNLIAFIVYWLVLLVFVLAAAESLGLAGVANALDGFVAYLPNVLAAAFILLLGALIARLAGDTISAVAAQAGMAAGPALGQVIRYVLLVFAVILAMEQLGIATDLLTATAAALIAALALALALAFGLGSREIARNIMAGFHAKESFKVGQKLQVKDYTGRLRSIGPVKSLIETEAGIITMPNFILTDEDVTIIAEPPGTE